MTPDLHNQLQKNSCRENIKLSITTEDNQIKKREFYALFGWLKNT